MTKAKHVAESLKETQDNPLVAAIQDRTFPIDSVIPTVTDFWTYDLFSRKPSPAYTDDGVFQGTDLDLAAFLFALQKRGAIINLPTYKSMRGSKVQEGVTVTSKDNRHGELLGLLSNKETFVFSVRMMDKNVTVNEKVGDFRTFSLTGFDGNWYDGWRTIQFKPDAKENEFMEKTGILSGHKISFKNFVHPNRWVSFYGKYYFISKLLIERLTDESAYYNKQIKAMKDAGFSLPEEEITEYPKTTAVEATKSIQVDAFEAVVDFVENTTEFPHYTFSNENLLKLYEKRKLYTYTIIPMLRFMTRATECAFDKHIVEKGLNSFPAWLKDVTWEENYKPKGKKTLWNRIVFYQPGVGKTGVAIRFRKWKKAEQVNEGYVE